MFPLLAVRTDRYSATGAAPVEHKKRVHELARWHLYGCYLAVAAVVRRRGHLLLVVVPHRYRVPPEPGWYCVRAPTVRLREVVE